MRIHPTFPTSTANIGDVESSGPRPLSAESTDLSVNKNKSNNHAPSKNPAWTKSLTEKAFKSEKEPQNGQPNQFTDALILGKKSDISFSIAALDLLKISSASIVAAALRKGGVPPEKMIILRKDIGTMLDLMEKVERAMESSANSLLCCFKKNKAGKNFSEKNNDFMQAYGGLFKNCNFKDEKIAEHLENLKENLDLTEKNNEERRLKNTGSAAPHVISTSGQSMATLLALEVEPKKQTLIDTLVDLINQLPREEQPEVHYSERAPEPVNYANQYGRIENEPAETASTAKEVEKSDLIYQKYGEQIPNIGGGDCLFHALSGRNLSMDEILKVRDDIANKIEENNPDQVDVMNAYHIASALSQSYAMEHSAVADLMRGRDKIPNRIYASSLRIPGLYAGEPELQQWSLLDNNKNKNIVVISTRKDERLRVFQNGEIMRMPPDPEIMDELAREADILLYKEDAHWTQIK